MVEDKQVVEKIAWPSHPIDTYQNEAGEWGYLIIYSDDSVNFLDTERPTSEEIRKRWDHYFQLNG